MDRGLGGVMIVAVENSCLEKLRAKIAEKLSARSSVVFVASLRSKHEKLQFESLLKHGDSTSYHKNPV